MRSQYCSYQRRRFVRCVVLLVLLRSSSSSSLLLLELLREELELDVVGRVRVFVEFVEEERLTLEREREELEFVVERLTLELLREELVVERLTLDRERDEPEFDVVVLYFGRELLLVLDENDRFDEEVERL